MISQHCNRCEVLRPRSGTLHKILPSHFRGLSSRSAPAVAQAVQGGMSVTATGVDHIVLRVKDPVNSAQWYATHLGLAPVRLDEYKEGKVPFPSARVSQTFLIDFFKREGDEEGQEATLPGAGSDARRHTGFDHFCLVVQTADIEAVRQQLSTSGIEADPQFDGVVVKRFGAQGNANSIYIRDPDGYVVELRSYAQQEKAAAAADPTSPEKPVSENKVIEGSGI